MEPIVEPSRRGSALSDGPTRSLLSTSLAASPHLRRPETGIVVDVSRRTLKAIPQLLIRFHEQRWTGRSTSIPYGRWMNRSRTREGHHPTRTHSQLVVERVNPSPARDTRDDFPLERHPRWRFWRTTHGLALLPPRLPSLVSGHLGHPEALGFLGQFDSRLGCRHARCRTAPLDLVFSGCEGDRLDDTLRGALQDRATQDTIRQVHLRGTAGLLNSVISSIITKGEEAHASSARSFIARNTCRSDSVDLSNVSYIRWGERQTTKRGKVDKLWVQLHQEEGYLLFHRFFNIFAKNDRKKRKVPTHRSYVVD
jgi:hypothetical protein